MGMRSASVCLFIGLTAVLSACTGTEAQSESQTPTAPQLQLPADFSPQAQDFV